MPLTACFEIIQYAVYYFYQTTTCLKFSFCYDKWDSISILIVSLSSTWYTIEGTRYVAYKMFPSF